MFENVQKPEFSSCQKAPSVAICNRPINETERDSQKNTVTRSTTHTNAATFGSIQWSRLISASQLKFCRSQFNSLHLNLIRCRGKPCYGLGFHPSMSTNENLPVISC